MKLAVAVAVLHIEKTIAQKHGNGITALAQKRCHVMDVVIYGLAVFTPKWGKLAVAYLLSVEGEFVMSKATDICHSINHLAGGVEFLA